MELRGAPGTQTPAHSDAHGLRPTRTAFERPPGSREPGPAEPDCSGRRPPLRFRSPSEVHQTTPAPSRRPEGRPVGQCFLPWALPAVRHVPERRTRIPRGLPAPLRAASGVWVPPSRRPPPSLPTPFGAGASFGFSLQGVLLAAIGPPLGGPCPHGVARVDSPRPQGGVRTRSTPGPRSRREFVRTIGSRRTRCVDAFLGFTLQSTLPLRPGTLLCSQSLPPARVGWCDVQSHLRLGVLRRERVGWPLSGLPALLGFSTLRPSRRRSGRRAGRAHGFASRLVRVAGGANRSEPRHERPSRRRSADPSSAVHR